MDRSEALPLDLFTMPLWQQDEGMDNSETSPAAGGSLRGAGVRLVAADVCEDSFTRARARVAAHAPG
jgi:hypothetical protein